MNSNSSLPIKLAEIRRDLQQLLNSETDGVARRSLIDQAQQAIERVIQEFEEEGVRQWMQ